MLRSAKQTTCIYTYYNSSSFCRSYLIQYYAARTNQICKRLLHTNGIQRYPLPSDIGNIIQHKLDFTTTKTYFEEDEEWLDITNQKTRAKADVHIEEIKAGEEWAVGFIQAVSTLRNECRYGIYGHILSYIPKIEKGLVPMICDARRKDIPWYSKMQSRKVVTGPVKDFNMTVKLKDYPCAYVPWNIQSEHPKLRAIAEQGARLTRVNSTMSLHTWLVVQCLRTEQMHILTTTNWGSIIKMDVDCSKDIGNRARLKKDSKTYFEHVNNTAIPDSVFLKQTGNDSIEFVFYPRLDDTTPLVIAAAVENPSESESSEDPMSDSDSDTSQVAETEKTEGLTAEIKALKVGKADDATSGAAADKAATSVGGAAGGETEAEQRRKSSEGFAAATNEGREDKLLETLSSSSNAGASRKGPEHTKTPDDAK